MSRYTKNPKVSPETRDDALKIARGTQKPGQTKEQTRLIAQGIRQGIELYKKQHKAKARELDRRLQAARKSKDPADEPEVGVSVVYRQHWLPWTMLVVSWAGFAVYLFVR